jgi:hypothetical protein
VASRNKNGFLRNEKGQLAPAEDLPTMMIMITLLIIFMIGAAQSYDTYNQKRELSDKAEVGLNFLDTLKNNVLADREGDVEKPGMIYIDVDDTNAPVKIDTTKTNNKNINGKNHKFYGTNDPYKLGEASKSTQAFWNRPSYFYEIILKDESTPGTVYVIHGGWLTKFSSGFNPDGESYEDNYDHLVTDRVDVYSIDLPVAIRYGSSFPEPAMRGKIKVGKIQVFVW